jgi:hypothetical protein
METIQLAQSVILVPIMLASSVLVWWLAWRGLKILLAHHRRQADLLEP